VADDKSQQFITVQQPSLLGSHSITRFSPVLLFLPQHGYDRIWEPSNFSACACHEGGCCLPMGGLVVMLFFLWCCLVRCALSLLSGSTTLAWLCVSLSRRLPGAPPSGYWAHAFTKPNRTKPNQQSITV